MNQSSANDGCSSFLMTVIAFFLIVFLISTCANTEWIAHSIEPTHQPPVDVSYIWDRWMKSVDICSNVAYNNTSLEYPTALELRPAI